MLYTKYHLCDAIHKKRKCITQVGKKQTIIYDSVLLISPIISKGFKTCLYSIREHYKRHAKAKIVLE